MNCRQSWLLSCLSEKSCRRCMYRYARATRTLRAVAALLALHADEIVSFHVLSHRRHFSFLPKPHTGLAFLFDVRPCRRLRLGGGARLCACQAFVSPRSRLPSASAFACEQTRRQTSVADKVLKPETRTVCLRDCLRACRDIANYLTQHVHAKLLQHSSA